ncbi:hypothetical protein [Sinimarinibacterium sp. CAU 1509]|uniref:hypothetical protein n=1 Tax=Sinimarinibacterium sp. CAU 1509 TaxID=2562283 RepID=UPI00146DAD05|nr:hypothetical protein [Sinimarinibacterium sp. CAU 1509]
MSGFLDGVRQRPGQLLWLDSDAYAWRLFGGDARQLLQAAEYVAMQRKAQGLLRSDVVALDVATMVGAVLDARPALRAAMTQKRRAVAPLKTLVADAGLRQGLDELLSGLRGSFASTPLALVMPSPRRWLRESYAQAFGADAGIEIGEDEIDSAAVQLADFLRHFGESGIDVLLMSEDAGDLPAAAGELEWYRPVLNVAAHYRWDLGLRLDAAPAAPLDADGIGFVIAPSSALPAQAGLHGRLIEPAFWSADTAAVPGAADFRYAAIPADAQPETVLARLAALRA